MRGYFFTNMYLSPIQKGIQTAHCVAEMFSQYKDTPEYTMLNDWSKNHKTIIVLDGGNHKSLCDLYMSFRSLAGERPIGIFFEDSQSLNNAATCVGIVLEERIYNAINAKRELSDNIDDYFDLTNVPVFTNEEILLIDTISKFNLAR